MVISDKLKKSITLFLIKLIPISSIRKSVRKAYRTKLLGMEIAHNAIDKKVVFLHNSDKYDFVAIGSSHCQASFNPAHFDVPSFNFGLNSLDNFMMLSVYRECIKKSNVKNIIVFYDVFSAGSDNAKRKDFNDMFFSYKYIFNMNYSGEDKKLKNSCEQYEKNISKTIDYSFNGYVAFDAGTPEDDLVNRCATHLKIHNKGGQDKWLIEFLNECKNDNKNIIFILSPAKKCYKEKMPDSKIIFGDIIQELKNLNLTWYNLYDTDIFENDEFWIDMDHTNDKGAEVFTKHLNNLLKQDNIL